MSYLGDLPLSAVIDLNFETTGPTGAGSTLSGGTVSVYQGSSTTQTTTGVTLTADFDGVTGLNHVTVDTSTDGTFYATGRNFSIVLTAGTVGGVALTGPVGNFTINAGSALRPTTAGRTLTVSAAGASDANLTTILGTTSSGAAGYVGIDWAQITNKTTVNALTNTTISSAQVVASVTARVTANTDQWAGGTIPAPNVTGVPLTDLKYTLGTLSPATAGYVAIDWAQIANKTATVALTNTTISGGATPTAAAIATAVWQDATPGDFTTVSSIGKSLYTAGVVPGAAGGLFIAGTNAATAVSITGTWTGNLTGSVGSVTGLTASNLDTTVSSRAPSATALSTANWTNTRAGYLDNLGTALTETYSTFGVSSTYTFTSMLYDIRQRLYARSITGTSETVFALDGTTGEHTITTNSATTPTSAIQSG